MGKNEVVKQLLAQSAKESITFYVWYDTRPENIKDFFRAIPAIVMCVVILYMVCFL